MEPSIVESTLLNYDAVNGKIIVEVEAPLLSTRHKNTQMRILPRVDELLKAVKGKLETLKSSPNALTWRLLTGNVAPRRIPWSGALSPQG